MTTSGVIMARLIYSMITSLDGYVADDSGAFEWAAPDEQVHAFVNDLERPIGTYLYGRRMYETMQYWEGEGAERESPVSLDFRQLWQAADKIVYSSSLKAVTTNRTRLARKFDPDEIRELKRTSDQDISVGGPALAAHAIRAGLVDEYHLFVNPIVVGGGNQAIPDGVRIALELADERRFRGGVVYLRYVQPG
jgi:dihydrofolate reductase